jgi:hypothetical protein
MPKCCQYRSDQKSPGQVERRGEWNHSGYGGGKHWCVILLKKCHQQNRDCAERKRQ